MYNWGFVFFLSHFFDFLKNKPLIDIGTFKEGLIILSDRRAEGHVFSTFNRRKSDYITNRLLRKKKKIVLLLGKILPFEKQIEQKFIVLAM